ncbi:MAG: ABC transporter permease [Planctomycetes bacterium]|nr:ABC transporter permease [Planctomycetota bacterium]
MNARAKPIRNLSRLTSEYGMVLVLLLLCGFFSAMTVSQQHPTGESAAVRLAKQLAADFRPGATVLIVARRHAEDAAFSKRLQQELAARGFDVLGAVNGEPKDARRALQQIAASGRRLDLIACTQTTSTWLVLSDVNRDFPRIGPTRLVTPQPYRWPNFLKSDNLLNIANQIAVIAIVAIGQTVVIITAGIDLSVGSLIALSAVASTLLIRDFAGAEQAGTWGMTLACLGGIALAGLIGALSGITITLFGVPPFIATLGMMLFASGVAYILSQGQSVYQVPDSFVWLGRGADLFGIPNAVVLMLALYAVAHVLMSRSVWGRYVYAVGGNREAARLSGVPVRRVILLAYVLSGALAGLGGIVMASQLKSGSPTYGQMYELYVIAAVVVGGTSLAGGEGKVLGTLIGAFIIAVIQNGMNLMNVESYTQKVVLGLVILVAVLLDRLKHGRPAADVGP